MVYHPRAILAPSVLLLLASACASPQQSREELFREQRLEMVRWQLVDRGISDTAVLRAMRTVPRHRFVPEEIADHAYADGPLPIGLGQTISQPYIVALMTELAKPSPRFRVLEVGTGSGYQAAVLAEIVDSVFTIEILEPLATAAQARLRQLNYGNIVVRYGDVYNGWPEHAPFDAILVTAAAEVVPQPLIQQLKEGGRMVIPRGAVSEVQELILIEKVGGKAVERPVIPVRFVPLIHKE